MINNNYGNFNNQPGNISYGAVKDVVPQDLNQKLPENIQNLDAKEIASNNGAVSAMGGLSPQSALATLPIYGAFVGLRTINDRKGIFGFAGEYDKSFLGKLSGLGDRISKAISNVVPERIRNGLSTGLNNTRNFAESHSAFVRSSATPLKLEHSFARTEASGLFGRVITDDSILFEKGFKGSKEDLINMFKGDGTSTLWKELCNMEISVDATETKGFLAKLSSIFKPSETITIKGIENARDGKDASKIVQAVLRKIGDAASCDTGAKNTARALSNPDQKLVRECTKDIIKALSSSDEKFVIDKWGSFPIGKIPIIGKLFTLNVPTSEVANKLRVAAKVSPDELGVATGAAAVGTTALGRALPNLFAKVYEGLTSDYVGGKMAPALQAFFIANAAMKAKDAPEGKKLATFMDEEASAATMLITMPLATSILTKAGGTLKYVGMGSTVAEQTANVAKYRNMVQELNTDVIKGAITRGEYLDRVKDINKVLNGDTKFWQKPLKALGKIIGSNYKGETIRPFISSEIPTDTGALKALGLNMSNRVQGFLYNFKTKGFLGFTPGGVLRFALAMFVLSPLVSKPIKWVVNKIFGKPYDPQKEKEEQAKKAQAEAMKNNPFTKMSDQELMELLTKNQDLLVQIQNDPKLMQEVQTNPQKLYELLQQGAQKADEARKNAGPSQMLQGYINSRNQGQQVQPSAGFNQPYMQPSQFNNGYNQNNMNTNAQMPAPQVQQQNEQTNNTSSASAFQEPKRTYIPSSKPADFSKQQSIENQRFNALLQDMENTEREYSQYVGI